MGGSPSRRSTSCGMECSISCFFSLTLSCSVQLDIAPLYELTEDQLIESGKREDNRRTDPFKHANGRTGSNSIE